MVQLISGFAPQSRTDEGLAEQLKRSEEILAAAQKRTSEAATETQDVRQQTTQGRTSAETIGKGIGNILFGNKPLKDRQRLEAELAEAQRQAQEHVAKQRELAEANAALEKEQGRVDADVSEALLEFQRGGVLTPSIEDKLRGTILNDAMQQANIARTGAPITGVTFSQNTRGDLMVNIQTNQGTSTGLVRNLLSDNGAGLDKVRTDAAAAGLKQDAELVSGATVGTDIAQKKARLVKTEKEAELAGAQTSEIEGKDPAQIAIDDAIIASGGKEASEILKRADTARVDLAALSQIENAIDIAATGAFAEPRIFINNLLGLAGLEPIEGSEGLTALEDVKRGFERLVSVKILEGGRGITDEDAKILSNLAGSIGSSKQSNRMAFAVALLINGNDRLTAGVLRDTRDLKQANEKRTSISGQITSLNTLLKANPDVPMAQIKRFMQSEGMI